MGLLPVNVTKRHVSIDMMRWLLIGEVKIGKTTILSGFPNLLLLATEKGYHAHDFSVINIVSWRKEPGIKYGTDENGVQDAAFVDVVDEICKGQHNFKTIAVDTLDVLVSLCIEWVCKHLKIKHVSDLGYGKAYDFVKTELNNELNKLFMSSYGLIFTSHVRARDIIKPTGTITKITSSLNNQARDVVHAKVSTIGLMKAKTVKVAEGKYEEKRVISFKPSELEEVGDRYDVFPSELIVPNNPKDTYELIKKYYDEANNK